MFENVAIFPSELCPSRIGNSGSFHVSHQEDSKFKGFLFAVFYRTIWRREDKRGEGEPRNLNSFFTKWNGWHSSARLVEAIERFNKV